MPTPFLSSEEYDERAHKLYDRGDYDAALDTLKEGLQSYPNSVDLYVGMGYTRLAREEYVWAKHAFEKALVLDPEHYDAMVGLGEALLRFGGEARALGLFRQVYDGPGGEDTELLLAMGRALYREGWFIDARMMFERSLQLYPDDPEVRAALAYTLHRLDEEDGAVRELEQALALNPRYHEARVYLGHLFYDRGDLDEALAEFVVPAPTEQWDSLAVWRLIELKKKLEEPPAGDPELMVWESRLEELESEIDLIDELMAEIESAAMGEPWKQVEEDGEPAAGGERSCDGRHRVRLPDGSVLEGSWIDIVRQLRDQAGRSGESIAQFMRRWADDTRVRIGVGVPTDDAEGFLLAYARAGLLHIER